MAANDGRHATRRRFYRKKRYWIPAVLVMAFGLLVGPWPIYTSSYQGTSYATATFARVDALPTTGEYGMLRVGTDFSNLDPHVGEPMAGYSARKPMASDGVGGYIDASAITISNDRQTVTIVGGDILLFMPQLRDEVLRRTGLQREEVFFTAGHTHSGLGGYSSRWVDQIVLGKFDPAVFDRIAGTFAQTILLSREEKSMVPAELTVNVNDGSGQPPIAVNRLVKGGPTMNTIYCLRFRELIGDHRRSALFVASPHPTCLPASSRTIHGDYPAILKVLWNSPEEGPLMFAAGAVGSMGVAATQPRGLSQAKEVGGLLASRSPGKTSRWNVPGGATTQSLPRAAWHPKVLIQSHLLEVDLPPQQYRITQGLRLSPIACRYLHGRRSYIHVLRIRMAGARASEGDIVFLGMPADYSGELAMRLADEAKGLGLTPIVTSFNGDYVGYLLPQERYWLDSHETLDENLCGPWGGEYFHEIALRTLRHLKDGESH